MKSGMEDGVSCTLLLQLTREKWTPGSSFWFLVEEAGQRSTHQLFFGQVPCRFLKPSSRDNYTKTRDPQSGTHSTPTNSFSSLLQYILLSNNAI